MKSKTRLIALASIICFLFVFILSSAFVLTHADHAHDHNGVNGSCATCVQLQNTENTLKQFNTAFVGVLFAIAGLYAAIGTRRAMAVCFSVPTPVMLRIRMND